MRLPGFDDLAKLQTFSPEVFIGKDRVEQEVCDFVLSLAVIYNDLKNLMWAEIQLGKIENDGIGVLSSYNGQVGGFRNYLGKMQCSAVVELMRLISINYNACKHPIFQKTLKGVNIKAKEDWNSIVAVALGGVRKDRLGKFLKMVRDKITFHVEPNQIGSGYKNFFIRNTGGYKMQAFISIGRNMNSTRFYFADASVEGYMSLMIGDKPEEVANAFISLFSEINRSLFNIILKFIELRGGKYSEYKRD